MDVQLRGFAPTGPLPASSWAGLPTAISRMCRTSAILLAAAAEVRGRLRLLPDDADATLERQAYLARLAVEICSCSGFEARARGPIPDQGPTIVISNHVSWQDPIMIGRVLPSIPIAKHEVRGWPLVGGLARGLDVLLLDRDSPHSGARVLLRARALLQRGASVLAFPEGTTTTGEGVLPLHRGMFGLAIRLGLPVVPIGLRYTQAGTAWVGDLSFFPHYLRTVARPCTSARLEFGAPLNPRRGETPTEFAERTRGRILELLSRP